MNMNLSSATRSYMGSMQLPSAKFQELLQNMPEKYD